MKILACLLFAALIVWGFIKATDRICEKNWSPEFRQTADYAKMHCPNH